MDFEKALFLESASRIMLLLNQHSLVNLGEEKVFTLADIEEMEKFKNG